MNDEKIDKAALREFIRQHSALWWWVPEEAKPNLSLNSIVEAILNYGEIADIKRLFEIIGIKRAAAIFFEATENRQRTNYKPIIQNFFTLYFKRHA